VGVENRLFVLPFWLDLSKQILDRLRLILDRSKLILNIYYSLAICNQLFHNNEARRASIATVVASLQVDNVVSTVP
jgi:hypothetical protein